MCSALFLDTEPIDSFLLILFARLQNDRWEVGMVRTVREVLRLETDGTAAWECRSVLPFIAVGPVICIELYTRFGSIDLHCASADGFFDTSCKAEFAFFFLI